MADTREAILARLVTVAETVPGVITVRRNKLHFSEEERPAISIFDGDEETSWEDDQGRGRRGGAPTLCIMLPGISLLLGNKPETVGSDLNAFRVAFLKAVLNDATLQALLGENGEMLYRGCSTGVMQGRTMEAEMGLDISFRYPLFPTKL